MRKFKNLILSGLLALGLGLGIAPESNAQLTSTAPQITLTESDQTLPAGRWRIRLEGDTYRIERNTAADGAFSTQQLVADFSSGGLDLSRTGGNILFSAVTTTSGAALQSFSGFSSSTNVLAAAGGSSIDLRNLSSVDGNYTFIAGVDDGGATTSRIAFINESHANNEGSIAFLTRPSGGSLTRVVNISSDGEVGIGTADPQRLFQISNDGATHQIALQDNNLGASGAWWLVGNVNGTFKLTQSTEAAGALTSLVDRLTIDASGNVVFNDNSTDSDLRIESDTNANHFVSDAGIKGGAFGFGREAQSVAFIYERAPIATLAVGESYARHYLDNGTDLTTAASGTHALVSSLRVKEPQIVIGTAGVTIGATVYIESAPTEAATNAALYVASGQSLFPDGSAAAPSIAFANDTDTGLRLTSGGDARVVVGGSDLLIFQSGTVIPNGDNSIILGGANSRFSSIRAGTRLVAGLATGEAGLIYAASDSFGQSFFSTAVTSSVGSALNFRKSRGTHASQTIVANNDDVGAFNFTAFDGSSFVTMTSIVAQIDGTPGASDMPGRLVFRTTADGASSQTLAFTIDSSQDLVMNTNSNIIPGTDSQGNVGTEANTFATMNSDRYDSGANTGVTATCASGVDAITVTGGVVTSITCTP